MSKLEWFVDSSGGGAEREFFNCRSAIAKDLPFLLAQIKAVHDLGLEEAVKDHVQGTDIFLFEHGKARIIYSAEPSQDDAWTYSVSSGADVVVLWIGQNSSNWSEIIDLAQHRYVTR